MGSIGTHIHWVSQPKGIKPGGAIFGFFILVRHSCWKTHSNTLWRIFIYSSSRPLRSNIKKLQFSLTLSLLFHLQTLLPSWHILVHGGSSWGWWLLLIHLQGVCSSMMFLEILHRKPLESCPISSPSTPRYYPASWQRSRNDCMDDKGGCLLIIVVSILGCL